MTNINIFNKITIVTTPHFASNYVIRFLSYYRNHPQIKLIIADSSPNESVSTLLDGMETGNIKHFKYPNSTRLEDKLLASLRTVDTPYCAICSDDDFITALGLKKAITLLEENEEYVCAHGNYILFWLDQKENKTKFSWRKSSTYKSIEFDYAHERVYHLLSTNEVSTYSSVFRTNILIKAWGKNSKYTDDYRFGELLPSLLGLVYGKMAYIDVLYCARSYSPDSGGQTLPSYGSYIREGSYDRKYRAFKTCLVEELYNEDKIPREEANNIIDSAMKNYLRKTIGGTHRFVEFKLCIKRMISKIPFVKICYDKYISTKKYLIKHPKTKIKFNTVISEEDFCSKEELLEFAMIKDIVVNDYKRRLQTMHPINPK